MKKLLVASVVLVLLLAAFMAACGNKEAKDPNTEEVEDNNNQGDNEDQTPKVSYEPIDNPDLKAEITIWGINLENYERIIPEFNKHYPNVKVTLVGQAFEVTPKTQTAIAAGSGGPDIVQYHYNDFKYYNSQAGLEDLLQPPYDIGRYKDLFTDQNWTRWYSVDNTKMLAVPFDHMPYITFYRPDVFEDYGYPSDPDELGEYLVDPDNWFDMARTFKEDDKWINQLALDPLIFNLGDRTFYDADMNYIRNTEELALNLDISKQIYQEKLTPNLMTIWDPNANQALDSGKLIMFQNEALLPQNFLSKEVPNTSGKWRATRLPYGQYAENGGTTLSILSQSKNKEAAWAFVQYAHLTIEGLTIMGEGAGLIGFKPMWDIPEYMDYEEPYLGGQELRKYALSLVEYAPHVHPTLLDVKAKEIWDKELNEAVNKNLDSHATLQKIQEDVEAAVKKDKDEILKLFNKE